MAHEIETLAYTGEVPWHGIGVTLVDALSPQEMLKKAGLDWTVSKRPIWTADHKDFATKPFSTIMFSNLFALVRDSDNKIFGVCGPKYQPFQNSEVFDFFTRFTEAGNMKMEVAGSLKGGLWVWALARLSDGMFSLMGEDLNYSYLLLCSPHIWGEAVTIMFTSIRVVCWNTLTQAMSKNLAEKFRYLHIKTFSDVKPLAQLSVEQAMMHKAIYEQKAKLLAETKIVDMSKLYRYIAEIIQPDLFKKSENITPTDFEKPAEQILTNYYTAPGSKLKSAMGTWWGAFNAMTYFYDHQQGRSGNDHRLYGAWISHAQAVTKRKAFDTAVQYAQAA